MISCVWNIQCWVVLKCEHILQVVLYLPQSLSMPFVFVFSWISVRHFVDVVLMSFEVYFNLLQVFLFCQLVSDKGLVDGIKVFSSFTFRILCQWCSDTFLYMKLAYLIRVIDKHSIKPSFAICNNSKYFKTSFFEILQTFFVISISLIFEKL